MNIGGRATSAGNDGGRYLDENGMTKQFTYVNHDPKTTIGAKAYSKEEISQAQQELKAYREKLVEDVLALPPSLCPISNNEFFEGLITRNVSKGVIEWNEAAIRSVVESNDSLIRDLKRFTSLRLEQHNRK